MSFPLRDNWLRHRHDSWSTLDAQFDGTCMKHLDKFLRSETSGAGVCPGYEKVFTAFERALCGVRVVFVGHDPYTDGRATGLAFAVPKGRISHSLNTISREIETDTGRPMTSSSELTEWADQGVLLLNTVLTARPGAHNAFSHGGKGWERFTDSAIKLVSDRGDLKVVFGLWGKGTWGKALLIDCARHFVLPPAGHPAGRPNALLPFLGCRHFLQVNRLLKMQRQPEIVW